MKMFTRLLLSLLLCNAGFLTSYSQTVISYETFPNCFNTGFTKPINATFNGNIGTWSAYSSDYHSTVVINNAHYQSLPYALKLVNYKTNSCSSASLCKATSPIVNCGNIGCVTAVSLCFKLYTYNISKYNDKFYFNVEVSKDNGATWTVLYSKTAKELYYAFGCGTWNSICVSVPSQFYNSSFRYKLKGTQNPGCNYDNYLYIDDVKIASNPCPANLKLGNQVWNDYDGDGKRDLNEPGIGGITVSLYNDNNADNKPDGAAIKTTLTDIKGQYAFTNLTAGRYITSIPVITGYSPSPNNSTTTNGDPNNNVDNDNNAVNLVGNIDYTNAITLSANEEPTTDGDDANGNLTHDMALCGNAFIGDFVWNDLNGNGMQDAGEPGINNQLVTITFEDGTTASTVTHFYDFDGYYNFPNLGGGTYKITFTTPTGLIPSPANTGSDDAKDSDPVSGSTIVVLIPNISNFTIDAGFTAYVPPPVLVSLGNHVWNDLNNNGHKDTGEPGLSGYTVRLYKDDDGNNTVDGAPLQSAVTAADGSYSFSNLASGKYIVGVVLKDGFNKGAMASATPDDNIDNDNNAVFAYNNAEVLSRFITLSSGNEPTNDGNDANSNFTLDFGLVCDHSSCHNDCSHTCSHPNCGHNSCNNNCNHVCSHPNCAHNSCKNSCSHYSCGHSNCKKLWQHRGSNKNSHNAAAATPSAAASQPVAGTTAPASTSIAITIPAATNNAIAADADLKRWNVGRIEQTSISLYPNPANKNFVLEVRSEKEGKAVVRIMDAGGKIMLVQSTPVINGLNQIRFDETNRLRSGTYNVQVVVDGKIYNKKLIIAK